MISITSTTFDLAGSVSITPIVYAAPESVRRVVRSRTLDGGVTIQDSGFSDGDKTLQYTWRTVSKAHNDLIQYLLENYPTVYVSTPDGFYLAYWEIFTPGPSESTVSLLVKERLD